MYLRFQVRSEVFAQIVRAELRRSDAGCIPPGSDGLAVERLEFLPLEDNPVSLAPTAIPLNVNRAGAPPAVVQRRPLVVTVPVRMVARTVDNWAKGIPEPNLTFTLRLRLGVDFVLVGGKIAPRVTYQGLTDDPTTPDPIEKIVDDRLRAEGIDRTLDSFDLVDKVFGLLQTLGTGTAPKVCWTGISLSGDGQCVEIRLELTTGDASGTHDLGAWQAFFAQQFDDRRDGMDLAVAVPQELVVEAARGQVAGELAGMGDFDLTAGPSISWSPAAPGLHVALSGTQIDACQCLWGEIDIDVDVAIDITIGTEDTPGGGNLVLDQRKDVEILEDLAVLCCVVTWPFDKLVSFVTDLPGLVVDVLTLPLRTLTASWDQPGGPGGPPPPPNPCTQDPDDEDHKVCRYPLGLNPAPDRCRPQALSILRPRVRGFADSLVLQAAALVRELALPVPVVGAVDPFVWHAPVKTCNGLEGQWEAVSHLDVTQGGGELRLDVKAVVPVTATGIFYRAAVTGSPACPLPFRAGIDVKVLPGAVNGINAPAYLVALTTGGNLMVTLPPVPARDQAAVDALAHEYPLWRVANCYIDQDDWPGAFDPHWLVDPPPDEWIAHHLWVIRAGGLQPGERVVVTQGPRVLATAVAGGGGTVAIEVVDQAEQVTIERQTPTGEAMPGQRYGLVVKQVLLGEVGHQRTTVPILALAATMPALATSTPHVSALTTSALVTFALGTVPSPTAVSVAEVVDVARVPDLVGADAVPEGFVGLAPNGSWLLVRRLPPAGGRRSGPAPFWVEEVIDLTDTGAASSRHEQVAGGRARRLVAASLSAGLAAGPREGVVVVEPRLVDEGRYGVDLGDGGGFIVGGSDPESGTTHYAARPWSDGRVRVGRTHVRLDDDRRGFRWFGVLGTATH